MQRSGPSVEMKVVILVATILVVQDLVLLAMYLTGTPAVAVQTALGGLLVLAVIIAAVWGNALARAIRRLTRACFVAVRGDHHVLAEPDRTDEIGELNDEINALVASLRQLSGVDAELAAASAVADEAVGAAPEALRATHDTLVALKELKEGAAAEAAIMRRIAGALGETRTMLHQSAGRVDGGLSDGDLATRLEALSAGARDAELMADAVVDEVARPDVDEAALARSVNGLRASVRAIAQVSNEAAGVIAQRVADARAAAVALERVAEAESARTDAARVAELMDSSAARGLGEATRLAADLRKLGLALEAYDLRRRTRG